MRRGVAEPNIFYAQSVLVIPRRNLKRIRACHLCEIVDRLQAKGVALRILNINLDTNDATGKLMLQIIGSIAEFERSIMLSRQRQGKGGRQISRRYPHSSRQSGAGLRFG